MARPDRWASWWWGAVPVGLKLACDWRPEVLWSTYPIATAHAIGHTLAGMTGLPWIADFRDPMAQDGYPPDKKTWRLFACIEARAIARARRSVFVTEGAALEYRRRYPDRADRIDVIENGYDEEAFAELGTPAVFALPSFQRPLVMLHSGIVYPLDRDPTSLMKALDALRRRGAIARGDLEIRFRAPVHDDLILSLCKKFDLKDFIVVAPHLPYRDALKEMQEVDGLLIMQAGICNQQIPAKFYEYVRAGRPLLGLTDPKGDTAEAMRRAGATHICALEDSVGIEGVLMRFLNDCRAGRAPLPSAEFARTSSRRARTAKLADLLDRAVNTPC